MRKWVLLFVLSPLVAELISGSTPLPHFLLPSAFLVYLGFYGLGAILVRETVFSRKLGYASILLFGAAFGVLEEGILLKSWFDPTWMSGQVMSKVLRVYGVNVLQPFANVAFHAVVSIAAPIALVEDGKPWLSKRGRTCAFLLFLGACVLLSRFNSYQIRGWQYLLGIGLFLLFLWLGFKVKIAAGKKDWSPTKIWVMSALFVVLLFVVFYTFGMRRVSWVVILGLALLLYCGYAVAYARVDWQEKHWYAGCGIVTGLLPVVVVSAGTNPLKAGNALIAVILMAILVLYTAKRK